MFMLPPQPWIQLYLRNDIRPSLDRIVCSMDAEIGRLEAVRGKAYGPSSTLRTFPWSPAVRALTVLLLRSAAHQSTSEEIYLEGEEGTLASSLDYAISKRTNWLLDMFDVRQDGEPMVRLMFVRHNPERKRPGPVRIRLNTDLWGAAGIEVYSDSMTALQPAQMLDLADKIEQEHVSRAKIVSDTAAIIPMAAHPEEVHNGQDLRLEETEPGLAQALSISYFRREEDLSREYLSCLRRRIIDRRFSFIGEGANDWFRLCESGQYKFFEKSLASVEAFAPVVASHLPKKINTALIIPGNCLKERVIIDEIGKRSDQDIFVVEISHRILERSAKVLKSAKGRKHFYFGDLSNYEKSISMFAQMKKEGAEQTLVVALGVFFASFAPGELFFHMRDSIGPSDYLLTGIRLCRSWNTKRELEAIVADYELPLFQRQVMAGLRSASIYPEDGVLEVEVAPDDLVPQFHSIRRYFRFTTDKRTKVGGVEFPFLSGERIDLGKSYLFSADDVRQLMSFYGFEILAEQVTEDTGEFLCRPIRQ